MQRTVVGDVSYAFTSQKKLLGLELTSTPVTVTDDEGP